MPVIFTRPTGAGGTDAGLLGTPTDGTYDDGLLDLRPNMSVADGVDEINEVLLELAPEMPNPLESTSLIPSRSFHSGKLPLGLGSEWYKGGKSAGDVVNYILEYDNLDLSSADPSTRFSHGDKGFLLAFVDNGGMGLQEVARLDIEANFDPTVRGPSVQDLSTWDNQGNGDPCVDGVVTFSGGSLVVTYCGWHNNFNKWQRMNAKISVNGLHEGYYSYKLGHKVGSITELTNLFELWYDNDTNPLLFSTQPDLSENSIISNKYLSGVRYYDIGDSFNVTYIAENIYRKCYHISNVSKYIFDGSLNEVIVNPVSVPNYTDVLSVNEVVVIDKPNFYTIDARLTAELFHPWKNPVNATTPSHNILINTYGNISTNTYEYFVDENYRLPDGNYDTIPSSLIGNWNSQSILTNGQALVFDKKVQYPNHDLSSTWPTGNPNYTGFSGDQMYLRGFYSSIPHNNVTLTLNGLDLNKLGEYGSNDVNILIKLPTQTGWLDAGKNFSSGDFTGSDGDGCLVTKNSNSINLTFGTFSTANSGGIIIVKIIFRNTNSYISGMNVDW